MTGLLLLTELRRLLCRVGRHRWQPHMATRMTRTERCTCGLTRTWHRLPFEEPYVVTVGMRPGSPNVARLIRQVEREAARKPLS